MVLWMVERVSCICEVSVGTSIVAIGLGRSIWSLMSSKFRRGKKSVEIPLKGVYECKEGKKECVASNQALQSRQE